MDKYATTPKSPTNLREKQKPRKASEGMETKEMKEALSFVCSSQFWRMAILWTCSLIISYFQLFSQNLFAQKPKSYPRFSPITTPSSAVLKRPVCIITGATSGLGAAAAHALSKQGFFVVLAGRSPQLLSKIASDIEKQNSDACVKAFEVDLSCFKSILKFKSSLQQWLLDSDMHPSIQLLINNAGILATSHRLTVEGYDEMMATNYIGGFCLTKVLLPLLENSPVPSRIVNVTSFTHRNVSAVQVDRGAILSGNCSSKSEFYPCARIYEYSKLCVLLFTYELHRRFVTMEKSHTVSVIAVDPGAVETNIMREIPSCVSQMAFFALKLLGLLQSLENGISSILDAALASPEISGVYFFGGNGRTIKSSALSYDHKLSKDLWDASHDISLEWQLATNSISTSQSK